MASDAKKPVPAFALKPPVAPTPKPADPKSPDPKQDKPADNKANTTPANGVKPPLAVNTNAPAKSGPSVQIHTPKTPASPSANGTGAVVAAPAKQPGPNPLDRAKSP